MDMYDILDLCKKSNVTIKTTFKGNHSPVDVVCNECGMRFPVSIVGINHIQCPSCVDRELLEIIKEVVKIKPYKKKTVEEPVKVVKTRKKRKNLYMKEKD